MAITDSKMKEPKEVGGEISNWRIARVGGLAAGISLLVVFFGGMAMRGHEKLMGSPGLARKEWFISQLLLSAGVAIVIGALFAAWRLMNRKNAQWGMAAIVAAVLLFGLFIWPTMWTFREFGCEIKQVNRLFGTMDHVAKVPACDPGETLKPSERTKSAYDKTG